MLIATTSIRKSKLVAAICLAAALAFPKFAEAAAGGVQVCAPNTSCVIGEFLYNDEYAPIPSASCNITSKYPNGNVFINNESLTPSPSEDGWHAKSFTAPAELGYYPTQVCCTVDGQALCIDKSFEVKEAQSGTNSEDIASAVWNYSGRTLSSFGSLTADIWNYSTRSLSTFGSLVSDIWNNATRTLTKSDLADGGNLATKADVENIKITNTTEITNITNTTNDIKSSVEQTQIMVDKLLNKPIIENVLEVESFDFGGRLGETKTVAGGLYINTRYLTSKTGALVSNWNKTTAREALGTLEEVTNLLGEEGDTKTDTVLGGVAWIKASWGLTQSDQMIKNLKAARGNFAKARSDLAGGRTQSAYTEVKAATRSLLLAEQVLGTSSDTVTKNTLYAGLNSIENSYMAFDQKEKEADKVLAALAESADAKKTEKELGGLVKQVLSLNKIPKITLKSLNIKSSGNPVKDIKNQILALKGLIRTNKIFIASAGRVVASTWLEEGSVVFKTLATNPSALSSQEVEIKYYLPCEVKEEDIIETDAGLSVKYDAEKDQYYVEGKLTLAPGESRTVSVGVDDVWELTDEKLESLVLQTEELYKPLEKTAFYAQAVGTRA